MSATATIDALALGARHCRITDREFLLFQSFVQHEIGIQLPESKRSLLVGRLARRLRELNLESFSQYYELVVGEEGGAERVHLIDRIVTNETHFFREPRQFEFLENEVLPAWMSAAGRARKVRVWSAACSTGEEPYSLAMTLHSRLPGWEIDVLSTDISTTVLQKARAAVWPIEKSREIPERHLKTFMLRGVGDQQGYMKAGPELRSLVRFGHLNLHGPRYAVEGPFDLIFCRNVLIYFSAEGRAAVMKKILAHLAPGGYLFLGHAETLNGVADGVRLVGPTVYGSAPRARPGTSGAQRFPRRSPSAETGDKR